MERYFEKQNSAFAVCGADQEKVIRLLAKRYMAENPEMPYVWRTFDETGIQADRKGGYHFDFFRRFPEAKVGDQAVAMGELPCPKAKDSNFFLYCKNPVKVYLNGELVFTSSGAMERSGDKERFSVHLKEGMNRFILVAEKTKIGFFCALQNAMPQWEPCHYVMPFEDRKGEAGFVYQLFPAEETLDIGAFQAMQKETTVWYPERKTKPLEEEGLFLSAFAFETDDPASIKWQNAERVEIALDEAEIGWQKQNDRQYLVTFFGPLEEIRRVQADGIDLQLPIQVHGNCSRIVLGPLKEKVLLPFGGVLEGEGKPLVWRPDVECMALRPYVETFLFGRWTYPLGVTLYGMLKAAQALKDEEMAEYVHHHVNQVTEIHDYALYDTEKYGFAGVNQQICWLDALDDCGSFGALILRCDPQGQRSDVRKLAHRIAKYMMQEQPCTEEGAFCRRDDTIWADDMYMSVPFLCRYGEMTGETEPLDFAARQMLAYRKLLFMPEKGVMAHMRCMVHDAHNGIPWSRGNGWVIFSLSELLSVLPKSHEKRPELIQFFRELTDGYLALQDDCGLWHQILDDPVSYLETSATAMFICAFARGIRNGWYAEEMAKLALSAAEKAWKGLAEYGVDKDGNLYGVCRGSGFSFSRAYYRSLSWNFNDTHGIGIVMLAGVEMMELANS